MKLKSALLLSVISLAITACGGSSNDKPKPPTEVVDSIPDNFTFTTVENALLNKWIESEAITISGINTATAISIENGEYRIDGGEYRSSSSTLNNGQKISVRTMVNEYSETNTTVVNIGSVEGLFKVKSPHIKLIFTAEDQEFGNELRVSNFVENTPQLIKDLTKNKSSGYIKQQKGVIYKNSFYSSNSGALIKFDLVTKQLSTVLDLQDLGISSSVRGGDIDIDPGALYGSILNDVHIADNELRFRAGYNTPYGTSTTLYKTNGTSIRQGTEKLLDKLSKIESSNEGLFLLDKHVSLKQIIDTDYLNYDDRYPELNVTNIANETAESLFSIKFQRARDTESSELFRVDNQLYFGVGYYANRYDELWTTNGTEAGTFKVSVPVNEFKIMGVVGNALIYSSDKAIYSLDNITGEHSLIISSEHGLGIEETANVGGTIVWANSQNEIWFLGGPNTSPVLVTTLLENEKPNYSLEARLLGERVTLRWNQVLVSFEHEGNSIKNAETFMIEDLSADLTEFQHVFQLGQRHYYLAKNQSGDSHTWISDGTLAGTRVLPGALSNLYKGYPVVDDENQIAYFMSLTDQQMSLYAFDYQNIELAYEFKGSIAELEKAGACINDLAVASNQVHTYLCSGLGYNLTKITSTDGTAQGTIEKEVNGISLFDIPKRYRHEIDGKIYYRSFSDIIEFDGSNEKSVLQDNKIYGHTDELFKSKNALVYSDGNVIFIFDYQTKSAPLKISDSYSLYEWPYTNRYSENIFFTRKNEEFTRDNTLVDLFVMNDQTKQEVKLKENIKPSDYCSYTHCYKRHLFNRVKNLLYFINDSTQIWRTDGTESGTKQILDISNLEGDIEVFGLSGIDFARLNTELFRIENGELTSIGDLGEKFSYKLVNQRIYLISDTSLWTINIQGSESELVNLTETLKLNRLSKDHIHQVSGDDIVFFASPNNQFGYQLWYTSGTTESTKLLSGDLKINDRVIGIIKE